MRGAKIKHGITVGTYANGKLPKIYTTWLMMKQRCYNPNHVGYERYKKLGVSKEWKDNFQQFYDDMNEEMEKHLKKYGVLNTTLDRINNTKGYSKENCRWATRKEQSNNRKDNIILNGMNLDELSKTLKIRKRSLYFKINKGWTYEELERGKKIFSLRAKQVKQKKIVLNNLDSLKRLKTRDRAILKIHLGIGAKPESLNDTGAIFGLSCERIRQIVNQSVKLIHN